MAARFPWEDGKPLPELFRPVGCSACSKTGYKGRLALHEVMLVSEEIERLAVEQASATAIEHVAREQGMRTLREDGLAKVLAGRHLARRDPPRRRLDRPGRVPRLGKVAGPGSRGPPDRPILSRDRVLRGLRCADARGVSRWRRPDTSRCPTSQGDSRQCPCPRPTPRRRTQAGPTPSWPTTLRRSRPTRWAACRPSRRTTGGLPVYDLARRAASPAPVDAAGAARRRYEAPAPAYERPQPAYERAAGVAAAGAEHPPPLSWPRPTCPTQVVPPRRRSQPVTTPLPPAPRRSRPTACPPRAPRSLAAPSRRPRSRPTPAARPRPRARRTTSTSTTCSMHVLDTRRVRPAPHVGRPTVDPAQRRAEAAGGPADPHPAGHPAGDLRRPDPEAAGEVRGEPRARLRLQRAGPGPVPREHLPPARRARRGVPHHPVRDQEARGPRRPAVGRELRVAAPWLRPRHRARPAPASRRRWRRSSTWPTGPAASTS